MFDIGFWELLLIAVLGLLVLGPERLPRVARAVGLWAGRARGYVRQISQELDSELRASELKRELDQANAKMREVQRDISEQAQQGLNQVADSQVDSPSQAKKPE